MKTDARPYSKAKIVRLEKHFGSVSKAARAASLSPATLGKYLTGDRTKLSRMTCAALDLLYIRTF